MIRKIVVGVLAIAYPVFVFLALVIFKLPVRVIGLVIAVFALSMLILKGSDDRSRVTTIALAVIAICVMVFASEVALKFYPVLVNAVLLATFGGSLFSKPGGIVYDFANLGDSTLRYGAHRNAIMRYCRKVTMVWCAFFVLNGSAALVTALFMPVEFWTLYNGFLTYMLIGLLFALEFIVRVHVQRRLRRPVFISQMSRTSREDDCILAYDGRFEDGVFKCWKDFLIESARLRNALSRRPEGKVVVNVEDNWNFILALCSILQVGKVALVPSNLTIDFMRQMDDGDMACLSDRHLEGAMDIGDILSEEKCDLDLEMPVIGPEARIVLYTSGSTGKPKACEHFLWELEDDNDSLGEYYRKDFQKRLLVSSVPPQHAFGIVFSIIKPFIHAVPISRRRILGPDELAGLGDHRLLLISTPSFLRLAISDYAISHGIPSRDVSMIVAGSPLHRHEAKKVAEVFGRFPFEIYGSTETGAIARRVDVDEEASWWTVNHSVKISIDDDGCLVVSCDGVHGECPFTTSDVVEIREDGRFRLFGRRDSIVKIAEKRVSLVEIADRVVQTGLVEDALAVRQDSESRGVYVAVVAVLYDEARARFEGMSHGQVVKVFRNILSNSLEGVTIPRKWRFVDAIPRNEMGKVQMEEVDAILKEPVV